MSIIVQNSLEAGKAPYNNSPSKAQYSFPRSSRFKPKKPQWHAFLYNLPEVKTQRATSFGFGTRFKGLFPKLEQRPDPTSYQLSSSFNIDTKSKAYTFGISREAFRKVYVTGARPRDPSIPGPGTYAIPKLVGLEGTKYTFRPKTSSQKRDNTPGPGTYPTIDTLNGTVLSTQKGAGRTLLGLTDRRFQKTGIERLETPGPGKYSHMQFAGDGTYFVSKFKSYVGQSIGQSKRPPIVTRTGLGTPGPGSYRAPSDFGQYQAKHIELKYKTEANSPRGMNNILGPTMESDLNMTK